MLNIPFHSRKQRGPVTVNIRLTRWSHYANELSGVEVHGDSLQDLQFATA